jgi:hypothetical protein
MYTLHVVTPAGVTVATVDLNNETATQALEEILSQPNRGWQRIEGATYAGVLQFSQPNPIPEGSGFPCFGVEFTGMVTLTVFIEDGYKIHYQLSEGE